MNPLDHLRDYLHPILSHFPIALLVVSVALDLAGRRFPSTRPNAWLLLVLGTLGAVAATGSGIVAHFPYEESAAHDAISTHQFQGIGTTILFIALTAWRWWSRRRGADAGASWAYTVFSVAGVALLTVTGMSGGELVYEWGVAVKGVTR
jgi:uncharacterized membrane protein